MFKSSISSTEGSKNLKCESKYVGVFMLSNKEKRLVGAVLKCCENFREISMTALERRKSGGEDEECRHITEQTIMIISGEEN